FRGTFPAEADVPRSAEPTACARAELLPGSLLAATAGPGPRGPVARQEPPRPEPPEPLLLASLPRPARRQAASRSRVVRRPAVAPSQPHGARSEHPRRAAVARFGSGPPLSFPTTSYGRHSRL